ncbi:MAG: sensor histidine kinase [Oscillospiraceae bacterium]
MATFFLNTVGFFLQFGTTVLLSILPFSGETFKFGKRRTILFSMLGSAVISVLFSVLIGTPAVIELFGSESMFGNTYMLLMAVVISVFYFKGLNCPLTRKTVNLCLVVFYEVTQYVTVNLLLPLFPGNPFSTIYSPETVLLLAATTCVMMPVMTYLLTGPVRDYLIYVSPKTVKREFRKVLIVSVVYIVVLFAYSGIVPEFITCEYREYSLIILPILSLNIICLMLFFVSMFKDSLRHERDAEYNSYLEIQRVEYRKITQEIENMRRTRHDFRHHLATIYELAESGSRDDLLAYIEEMLSVAQRSAGVMYCENGSINGLLQYYIGQGKNAGVECTVHAVCGEIAVSPVDITVMLGNTLENALHACESVQGRKFLDVNIGLVGGTLAIVVTNSCAGVHPSGKYRLSGDFLPAEAFASMRSDGGIGLKSIANTARSYGGDAQFRFDGQNQSFTTRIRLNIASEL